MIAIPNPWLTIIPAARGKITSVGNIATGIFRLPSDPLRYINLTFDGVNEDSEIRIYLNSTGEELAGVELCDTNHTFNAVPYYGTNQDCTVRIVNVLYNTMEFSYTIPGVDQVIPIQQAPDKWYKNP